MTCEHAAQKKVSESEHGRSGSDGQGKRIKIAMKDAIIVLTQRVIPTIGGIWPKTEGMTPFTPSQIPPIVGMTHY